MNKLMLYAAIDLVQYCGWLKWLFRVFSGLGSQVQPTAMEVNRVDEIQLIAEPARGVLEPDLRV
jgi:hypothetical protein